MMEKKIAARVFQHPDGGEQTRLDGFADLPENDFSTLYKSTQGSIAALLPRSRGSAVTVRELSRITGQTPRAITRRICTERRQGAPILSDPGAGFWLASDAAELARCARALHKRAGEIHKTARALENLMKGGI